MEEYRINASISAHELADLRQSVGWNRMEKQLSNKKLKEYFNIACYKEDRLIGYVCVISNFVTDAYIQDLMVSPEYQNRGIGKKLMNMAMEKIKKDGISMISVIYGEENLRKYYEQLGFFTMLCGQMELYHEE